MRPHRGAVRVFCATWFALLSVATAAQATTWNVNTPNDLAAPGCVASGPCSIRQALAAAAAGDTIMVPPGHYPLAHGELQMSTAVTLQGTAASTTTIDAGGSSRVLEVTATSSNPVTISNLTFTNGAVTGAVGNTGGGGIRVDSSFIGNFTLNGVTLTHDAVTATAGGNNGGAGLYDNGGSNISPPTGTLTITNSTITANTATLTGSAGNSGGGGVYNDDDAIVVSGSHIDDNPVVQGPGSSGGNNGGGGLYNDGSDITLTNSTVNGNSDTTVGSGNSGGAGVYNDGSTMTLTNTSINGNAFTLTGGSGNNGGGGAYNDGSTMTLTNSSINGNSTTITGTSGNDGGGGAYNDGNVISLTSSSINSNKLTLTGDTGSGNGGGGVYNDGNSLPMVSSTIDGNTATITGTTSLGGFGVFNDGNSVTMTDSSISGNSGSITGTGDLGGGGVFNDGNQVDLTRSSISDNTGTITDPPPPVSGDGGGAVYNFGGDNTFLDSTLSGNALTIRNSSATTNGGGAVYNNAVLHTITFSNSTVGDNSINAPGGAVLLAQGTAVFKSTILSGNHATPAGNCVKLPSGVAFTSDGFNLEDGNSCSLTLPSDHRGVDAKLAPVANYGGPTLTQALEPGSPAVGTGSCTDAASNAVSTDQRGFSRPDPGDPAGVCDVGAFEAQPTANTAAPSIHGTPAPGDKLTCSPGTWSNGPSVFRYQWNRNGSAISGATGATYVVQFADDANLLTCKVTGTNADGPGRPATSPPVLVGNKSELKCPKPTGKLSGTKLGPLSLGETLKAAEKALKMHSPGPFGFTEFCLYAGFGIRAATPSSKTLKPLKPKQRRAVQGKLVIALTPNRFYNLDGVLPGSQISAVPKSLHLEKPFVIGLNTWYLVPGSKATGLLKVRKGEIFEIGIANKQLIGSTRKQQKFFMQSFGH